VDNDARTELNILGNRGHPNFRKTGDLYGIMLLPESATSADVNAARKLLIDRGAADGATASSLNTYWYDRTDIVEFDSTNMVNAINLSYAWYGCVSLSGLAAIQAPNGNNFSNAWQNCSALTSFPAGAKLGTEATNVNFSSAWRSSGLTSFSTPLPTATTILSAWRSSSITNFSADLPLAIDAREAWLGTPLTSFSTPLPLVTKADYSWFVCSSITNFSAPLPVVESVFQAWLSCTSLTDFSADVFANWNPSSITSGVFNLAWDGCSALSAQSVENILTSIDASGKYATTNGASGGSALGDAGIDIDYNVATGSLSAATDAAIESLMGKGWQVFINGVLTVPVINNILVLSPAAAYSLRSFDSNDDPNVVNVRRSNDNATSDFTASEVSDGTLVAFVGAGNDGLVTTWYDQGGTNHANQIIASRQPKIVNGGALVTEGGLAALDFDGSNDYLKMTSNVFAENLEVAIVNHLQDGSSSNPRLITLSNGTDDNFMVLHQKSTDYLLLRCHSSEGGATTSSRFGAAGVIDDYNLIYATSKLSSDSYTCSVDGVSQSEVAGPAVGSGSYSISTIGVRSDIFSGSYITGTIQEVIVYDTDQSANRLGIAANINDHFDIYS